MIPYLKTLTARRRRHGGAPISWTIRDLCAAYNWPTQAAGGGVIALVELGGGWNQADVDQAFAAMGLPAPSITDVSVDGTANTPGSDADGEVALDIQIAAASYAVACGQAATIRIYWSEDIDDATAAALADGCDVCSISWGADEAEWGQAAADAMEATAAAAVASGMIVLAAAGDDDSRDGGFSPANVDMPASAPHVIGCGGTSKPKTGPEVVWNNEPGQTNGNGTGGGYSTLFAPQPWQIGAPAAPKGLGRMVPDLSANADPLTGYEIVLNGQVVVVGGTSCVAPLYAGLLAAINPGIGFITPALYQNPAAFTDITSGNNGTYDAMPGPDPCTGLGSPIGAKVAGLFSVGT